MRSVKKVLHVTPTYYPAVRYGGPIRSVHGLCRSLAGMGLGVDVFTTNVDGRGLVDVDTGIGHVIDGVAVSYYPCGVGRRIYRSPDMAAAIRAKIDEYDLIHNHSVFLWPTSFSARRSRCRKIPYIVSPRGMLVPDLIRRRGWLRKWAWIQTFERRNLARAAAIHVTSEIEEIELRKLGFSLPRVVCVPNGVDLPALVDPVERTRNATKTLLFLGRINWKKGLDRLIRALTHCRASFDLIIAGNDEENYTDKIRKMAVETGVIQRVKFIGQLEEDAKWRMLSDVDVLILPSYQENFGNVVLEAMAARTPVIVTPGVGASSVVKHAGSGVVADPNPQSLANQIDAFMDSDQMRAEMGARGRQYVEKYHSWNTIAAAMFDLYRSIVVGESQK